MSELEGQLGLFHSMPDAWELAAEEPCAGADCRCVDLCDECGTPCTASRECAEITGLYDEDEYR